MNETFGHILRDLRKANHLTQEQVAAKLQLRGLDVSRSVYSQIECGIHHIPADVLIALKIIFNVSYDDFFLPLEEELSASKDHHHV